MQDTTGQPPHNNNNNNSQHQKQKDQSHLQQQQSPPPPTSQQQQQQQRSVSIFVYKTLNTVFKSSRKIIFRVCEVASAKKSLKMFNLYSSMKNRGEGNGPTTGHDRFCQTRLTNRTKRRKNSKNVRRTNSANEIDHTVLTAAARRQLFSSHRSASSDLENSDHSEHSEKSPLVSVRLDSLAKIFFNKSTTPSTNGTTNRDSIDSTTTRPNVKYQYTALDSGNGIQERSPRERAARDRALSACQEWIQNTNGRYDIIAHLDEIGSRHNKNWFLINDTTVRTDRLMTLLPLPPDCIALEELPPSETPKGLFMELLGSLHHPYIYPVLDLGFLHADSINYACLVMPFNPRGSLKDLIYKAQWNEPWNRKYTRKPTCLPISQVQRLGRQILEALLFLRERGFALHGHLHSGNVILQNGVARLSGLENGLLGLSSRVNAVMWSRSISDIDNIDIICFGHLLYEMCVGSELNTPQPSTAFLEMELDRYPQILEVLQLIFEPQNGSNVTVEDLVLCDLFRNIDLRELRGPCVSTIKPSLSKSTLNLLQAVKKRQSASLGESFSEASSPCTPPSTPRDRRTGFPNR
ncbi:slowpoke-binding protein isoform X2 [Hermetia illucens]|uniref:slowpoke-binding protein isoform X2 n=1 Tax=Hermetia illucens TaxID=343691 RepID=UPI0018CC04BA|nr:slowpoke-binding protein isoform X2 [Hermetia illucens]